MASTGVCVSFNYSYVWEVCRFLPQRQTMIYSLQQNWAATWQNQQSDCAPSEDSDQPGHPPSLIRVFTVRMKKAWVLSYPLSAQRRLWSDLADAQADLSLHWEHTHFCRICFSMGDLGVQVSVRSSARPLVHPSTFTLGVLWAQLLLQFCTDLFETLHVFSSWYEDVHVVWI